MAVATKTRFATHLREVRLEGGFTQEGLAHRAGLTTKSVARYEAGGPPSPRGLALIVEALGLKGPAKGAFYYATERLAPGSEFAPNVDGELGLVVDGEWMPIIHGLSSAAA